MMIGPLDSPDLILAVTPFERPDARVAAAAARAGAVGVLDLGRDRARALEALQDTVRWSRGPFGVRVPPGCPLGPGDLPTSVETVILAAGAPWPPAEAGPSRRVLVEVTSPAEAQAVCPDADGLIAKGSEAGGRVGELSTFVLLQRLLAGTGPGVPVWASGGIGLHTAAGAVAGGAAGVVLDAQLALTSEAVESLAAEVVAAIAAMDGSETAVVGGHRVYTRPDLHTARPAPAEFSEVARRLGPELRPGWLPIGQDGAFARTLAQRYRTVGGVVQALRTEIRAHLQAAVLTRPLAEGSGIARPAGRDGPVPAGLSRVRPQVAGAEPLGALRLPVAQGPMTRVSDRAAFAAKVAGAGGLPFIALALMSGDDAGRLLAEAAEVLAGRPWGVGILGFVPPELREAQLGVVRAARPPYALIAGGRPGQAAALEAEGTRTFIHAPSPGLLDRFLADGARRFVFEGWECGGHIGPRASFPLWEAQIECLLAFGEGRQDGGPGFYESLSLLFAGGIHDHRP